MMDTFARCMHDLFRVFFHPLRVVSQLAERSLQALELADFLEIIRRACTILVLCRLGAVVLRVEHGGSDGHWFSVTPACGSLDVCTILSHIQWHWPISIDPEDFDAAQERDREGSSA